MAITTLAMVATVLVGNLYERKDRPVPKWLKKLMMDHMARVLCMGKGGNSRENAAFMKFVEVFLHFTDLCNFYPNLMFQFLTIFSNSFFSIYCK